MPEALAANLNLIDDAKRPPVPQCIWDQLKTVFVEQRPYGHDSNVFTLHPRPSNDLRVTLFKMANEDEKPACFLRLPKSDYLRPIRYIMSSTVWIIGKGMGATGNRNLKVGLA